MNYIHREYSRYDCGRHRMGLTSHKVSPTVEVILECDFTCFIEHYNFMIRHCQRGTKKGDMPSSVLEMNMSASNWER
jgi:hypothetical protein